MNTLGGHQANNNGDANEKWDHEGWEQLQHEQH